MMHVPKRFLHYLEMHKDSNTSIMNKARSLSYEELDVSTDMENIRIKKMVNSVLAEIHLMRGFVRLKPMGERVLYGFLKPQHDIGEIVCYFLSKRFPNTIIILGNNTRSWISIYDGKRCHKKEGGALTRTVEDFKELMGNSEEVEVENLWETYYWSQYCDDRRNIRYYKRNMPKKYQDAAGLKVARNTGRITLDDFDK